MRQLVIINQDDKILRTFEKPEFIPQEGNLMYLSGLKYRVQGVAFEYDTSQIIVVAKEL
jgi:hypothetical protein